MRLPHWNTDSSLELDSLGSVWTRWEKVAKVVRQRRVRERLMKYMLRLDTLRSSLASARLEISLQTPITIAATYAIDDVLCCCADTKQPSAPKNTVVTFKVELSWSP